MKTVFLYKGEKYNTLSEVAKIVGLKRVARRDMDRLGIKEVPAEATPETAPVSTEAAAEVAVASDAKVPASDELEAEDLTEDAGLDKDDIVSTSYPKKKKEEKTKAAPAKPAEAAPKDAAEALRAKFGYNTIEDLAADLKKKPAEEVIRQAEEAGLVWNRSDVPGINRMRAAIAIRQATFPGQRRPRSQKTSWKGIPLADLIKLARKHKLKFRETSDDKITRMWVIKALNDAGIKPQNG